MTAFAMILVPLALLGVVAYDFWFRFGARFNSDSFLEPLTGLVFLTYDDGPASPFAAWGDSIQDAETAREAILAVDPCWNFAATTTANLARVLAEYDQRALFFVRGDTLDADKSTHDVLRNLHDSGSVLGNHSFSHTRFLQLPAERCVDEVQKTDCLLRKLTGQAPSLFRPPWGQWHFGRTLRMWRRASLSQYSLPLNWTHATRDWEKSAVDLSRENLNDAVSEFLQCARATRSGIVLLQHDVWIYSVLYTRILLECLRQEPKLRIGDPSLLVEHARQTSQAARQWGGIAYYLRERLRLIKSRVASALPLSRRSGP